MGILKKIQGAIKGFSTSDHEDRYTLWNSTDRLNFNNKTPGDYLRYNDISLYINKAIEKRAEKVSEVQFVLRKVKGDEEVEESPLLDLLNKPNEFHTGKQFWKLFQKYLDLTGNAYILLRSEKEIFEPKKVTKMYLLNPAMVKKVVSETTGETIKYEYKVGPNIINYTKDEVLHCFEADPNNPTQGVSLLKAGVRAIETELQLEEYQANVLHNGGKVEGIFRIKGGLNKTSIDEMKEKYSEDLATAKKIGRPLFLGGDTEYQNVALNPTELSYLESKKMTLNDICILTGVPKEVLASVGETTFANADSAIAIFLKETIKPLLTNLVNFVDWRIAPEDLEIDFIDPTPEDIDKKIKIATALYATDSNSINERRELFGLEPIKNPDADEVWVSFSKNPLSIALEPEPVVETTPPEEKGAKKKEFNHPLKDKAFRDLYRKAQARKADTREAKMVAIMRDYFNGQEMRVKSRLTGIKDVSTKSLDEIFDYNLEAKVARDSVLPLLRRIMIEAGQETVEMLDYNFDFTFSSSIDKWLDMRVNIFGDEITRTTYDRLKNQFNESANAGEGREQLIKRIESVYVGFDENRARTIARTEVHGATQKANYEASGQAGSPIKIWVSVLDDVTRDSHAGLDGMEVPRNQPFPNGLQFAGDPKGEAGEVINCRCDTV